MQLFARAFPEMSIARQQFWWLRSVLSLSFNLSSIPIPGDLEEGGWTDPQTLGKRVAFAVTGCGQYTYKPQGQQ